VIEFPSKTSVMMYLRVTTHCNTLYRTASRCNSLQKQTATEYNDCNTLQHTATNYTYRCEVVSANTLQHTATHCNTLQHTTTHCNTLEHTATHCMHRCDTVSASESECPMHLHCNTLQHTATHCNTLQHTATHCMHRCDTVSASESECPMHLLNDWGCGLNQMLI